ncbi:MAG: Fic family protein [Oscillospiraceae bacterium]
MAIIYNIQECMNEAQKSMDEVAYLKNEKVVWNSFYLGFEYQFCWSSNSLEGNTLSLDETIAVVDFDEVSSGHSFHEYKEAKNLYQAIKNMQLTGVIITEDWIKRINGIIMGTDGDYRTEDVFIGNAIEAVYYPPHYTNISALMCEYTKQIMKLNNFHDIVYTVAKKHIDFERIHPFKDGNGRTGRIILNQMLMNYGLLPIAISPKSKYRKAFVVYDKNQDDSIMVCLLCEALKESAELLLEYSKKRSLDQRNMQSTEKENSIITKLQSKDEILKAVSRSHSKNKDEIER